MAEHAQRTDVLARCGSRGKRNCPPSSSACAPRLNTSVLSRDAARGLHFDAVDLVFLIGCASNAEQYLHLAGRAAHRPDGGEAGDVVTIGTPEMVSRFTARILPTLGLQQDSARIKSTPIEWTRPEAIDQERAA